MSPASPPGLLRSPLLLGLVLLALSVAARAYF
jgi:hypothetical protein